MQFLGVPLRKNFGSGIPLQVLAKLRFRYTWLWAIRYIPSRKRKSKPQFTFHTTNPKGIKNILHLNFNIKNKN
jgi:hypothetical protein